MKSKMFTVLLSAIFIGMPMVIFAQQEQITITTYYPSPYGNYRELRAQRMAIGDTYNNGTTYCWEGTCTTTIDPNADLVVEGNVGIGTTDPSSKLHVSADDTPGAIVGSALVSALSIWPSLDPSGTQGPALIYGSASNLRIGTQTALDGAGFTERARINSSGNVGIGTTSPGARLDVNGQIRIRGGGPAAGRVLTSDANGLATWQASTSSIGPVAIVGMRQGETGNAACIRVSVRYGGFWSCRLSFVGDNSCTDATGSLDNVDLAMCFNSANSPGNAVSMRASD